MIPMEVPETLADVGREALAWHLAHCHINHLPTLEEQVRAILAEVLPAYRDQIATGLRDAAQAILWSGSTTDALTERIWADCGHTECDEAVMDDPRAIARAAYIAVAARIEAGAR